MKKKIIALILIIPLLFLVTLFSVSKVAGIFTEIPASGIKITTQNDDGLIYLDMARYEKDIYLKAEVEPQNAKNKEYSFEISKVDEETALADVEIASDGLLIVRGEGKAKITAISADKGFTDSVILSVYSSKILSITPYVKTFVGEDVALQQVGDSEYNVTLASGEYEFGSIIEPNALSDSAVSWVSDDTSVVSIDEVTGRAKARLSGSSKVSVTSTNGINGVITKTINVSVPYSGGASGMSIEGKVDNTLVFSKGRNEVSFYLELEHANIELGETQFLGITGVGAGEIINQEYVMLDDVGKKFEIILTLSDNPDRTNLELLINLPGKAEKSELELIFNEFKFDVYNKYHLTGDNVIYQKIENEVVYTAFGEPADKEVTYVWDGSGLNIKTSKKGAVANITAPGTGDYALTVSAYEKGKLIYTKTKTISVVRGIQSIEFIDNTKTYGVENILAIGDTEMDASGPKTHRHELKMNIKYTDGTLSSYTGEDIIFSTSNSKAVSLFQTANEFRVVIKGDGLATIGAKWEYGEYFNQDVKTSITVRGVKDGMMVDSYEKIKRAEKEGVPIVLTADVMLGWKDMNESELKASASKMPTDYDWTFYKNTDINNEVDVVHPEVYYLLEFKDDVYGNGYTINADNFTMARDKVGNPKLFKGPLNFVAAAGASVKAQDNIVFLVRNDGVTINNVNLLGCSNESLIDEENGGIDLTRLNYAGTTLEISADNCNLINSRVSNGRTVVRVFGGETTNGTPIVENFNEFDINDERIHVNIESSILTGAREFILKIGSNRAILPPKYPNMDAYQQRAFFDGNGNAYDAMNKNNYRDSEFYNKYVITDVILKNSVLENSGLLSIGMETHFSGSMLDGYSLFPKIWNRCSATSFASVLRMEGEVKMYDWKKLDNVDSSTLIETEAGAREFLTLRIADMLKKVAEVKPECANIITEVNGQDYLHGGIAFYGGGYNYSCIDMDKFNGEKLSRYNINISVLAEGVTNVNDPLYSQGTYLPLAAGKEPFTFYMYNKDSVTNYDKQVADIASGNAYKLPIAVIG